MPSFLPPEDPIDVPANLFSGFSDDARYSLRANWPYIRTHYHLNRPLVDEYIMRLQTGESDEIADKLELVLYNVDTFVRVNFALSYVIKHKVTGQEKVFYASNNTMFLDSVRWIQDTEQADELCEEIRETDVLGEVSSELPSSKWRVIAIVSMSVHILKIADTVFL